jgi:hypothetical protein
MHIGAENPGHSEHTPADECDGGGQRRLDLRPSTLALARVQDQLTVHRESNFSVITTDAASARRAL